MHWSDLFYSALKTELHLGFKLRMSERKLEERTGVHEADLFNRLSEEEHSLFQALVILVDEWKNIIVISTQA